MSEVQGRIDTAAAAMTADWPDTHLKRGARFRLFREANSEGRALTTASVLAMGIIGLVLLLACFNVANLLLARVVERQRDMGIRSALGAGTARLVRLAIIEGVVIAVLAGAAAIVVTMWTQTLVGTFAIPIDEPQHIDLTPDATVLGFIALLVLIAGVIPGLGPALKAARVDVVRVLGSHGAGSTSGRPSLVRRWLVGAQIAGSTAFLAIAALFLQSYGQLSSERFGFDRDRLLVANFVKPLIETAQAVDTNVSISAIKPMEDRLAVQLWPFRTASWVFSICGSLALALATVWLAGVVIHSVNRRRREFGVRVSIGATPRDLVADVLKSGARLLLPGVITGVLLAAGVASLVRAAFVGVNVLNPMTYVAVAALEGLIVLVACASPALRAARVDPLTALRSE